MTVSEVGRMATGSAISLEPERGLAGHKEWEIGVFHAQLLDLAVQEGPDGVPDGEGPGPQDVAAGHVVVLNHLCFSDHLFSSFLASRPRRVCFLAPPSSTLAVLAGVVLAGLALAGVVLAGLALAGMALAGLALVGAGLAGLALAAAEAGMLPPLPLLAASENCDTSMSRAVLEPFPEEEGEEAAGEEAGEEPLSCDTSRSGFQSCPVAALKAFLRASSVSTSPFTTSFSALAAFRSRTLSPWALISRLGGGSSSGSSRQHNVWLPLQACGVLEVFLQLLEAIHLSHHHVLVRLASLELSDLVTLHLDGIQQGLAIPSPSPHHGPHLLLGTLLSLLALATLVPLLGTHASQLLDGGGCGGILRVAVRDGEEYHRALPAGTEADRRIRLIHAEESLALQLHDVAHLGVA
ncbi:hypothetical protein E2C01_026154 [Portunus trituberculatus]|uniref:Uncharacterized protein n=1 Tax=Portunus trituberculatus TaxID=210409 RepID=A0A5B7EIE0_PORTR|nr:hypothetical protein [Portunus trituberculatus]